MKSDNGMVFRPLRYLDYNTLKKAKIENIQWLAKVIGIEYIGLTHDELAKRIVRWYKRNPQRNYNKR